MKSAISLILILPFMSLFNWNSSPEDPAFDQLWAEVEARQNEGKPRAASYIVDDILDLAKKKENAPQWVKAIQFKANFIDQLEESGQEKALSYLTKLLNEELPRDVKSLTYVSLAEKLKYYVINNFYRINTRTVTVDADKSNFSTWATRDFEKRVFECYTLALENEGLKKIDIHTFDNIINEGEKTIHLTPTLYEFIAHKSLDHLANKQSFAVGAIESPLDWSSYIIEYGDFIDLDIPIPNSNYSKQHYALSLFQELIRFQNRQSDKSRVIHTELKRLTFIKDQLIKNEDERVLDVLSTLSKKAESSKEVALVHHDIAKIYLSQAGNAIAKKEAGELNKKAHSILVNARNRYVTGYGVAQCVNLIRNMEMPQLSSQMEKAVSVNQPSLMRIDHKGLSSAELSIYKISKTNLLSYYYENRSRKEIQFLTQIGERVVERELILVDNKDFNSYSSEFIIRGLTAGNYVVVLENKEQNILTHKIVQSTNLAYASSTVEDTRTNFVVFHRTTGKPLPNVTVNLYTLEYRNRSSEPKLVGSGQSDRNGFYAPENITSRSVIVELVQGDDVYFTKDNQYMGRNHRQIQARHEASIFTDRSIFRPGQIIYYKAIAYKRDNKGVPSLSPDLDMKIELVNPHGKIDKSVSLITNDYGSVEGQFIAPSHGLKGQYFIRINGMSNQMIRIEEYKRPKFKVSMSSPEGELIGGTVIKVPGLAESFAGVALENAEVSYQIMRSKQYPYYWWYHGGYGGGQGDKLIAVGTLKTDTNGEFEIPFTSELEKENLSKWRPINVYRVTADVTDENGETRSASFIIKIGQDPYYISTNLKSSHETEKLEKITIYCQNAMEQPTSGQISVEIHALISPTQPKVKRLWSTVDYPIADLDQFNSDFPQFDRDEKIDYTTWALGSNVLSTNLQVETEANLAVERLPVGAYRILIKDENGNEKYVNYFTTFSLKEKSLLSDQQFAFVLDQLTYQPGQSVQLLVGSGFKNSNYLLQLEKDHKIIQSSWLKVGKDPLIEIPVNEADRGGFVIRLLHVIQNRIYTQQINIAVPWTNKKLDVTWETFRDKLLPGQDEVWRLKISGPDKEAAAAEVLAGMYDASLDEFLPHNWALSIFPTYYSRGYLRAGGFGLAHGQRQHHARGGKIPDLHRQFPSWMYLGQNRRNQYAIETLMRSNKLENDGIRSSSVGDANADTETEMVDDQAGGAPPSPLDDDNGVDNFSPRQNLNETVFFFPDLKTDREGNVIIEFKMNEALTSWKFQLLAHTRDLKIGLKSAEIKTQKDLMIFPQLPRFIRDGDEVILSAKINKLVDHDLSGEAWIQIMNAIDGSDLTSQLIAQTKQSFTMHDENQLAVYWKINVPVGFQIPVEVVIRAKAGEHTDGELNRIPVLTNRILFTETLPFSIRAGERKKYKFNALDNMTTKGVSPHRLTLEFMENPVWFAVQSLPYLTDYPHQCTEQIAHKIYANSIAAHIVNQYPQIKRIFEEWRSKDDLISNLNKNPELKSILIEETPWLRDAESEEQQMKNIALLFDYNEMANRLDKNIDILLSRQLSSGGFSWFADGRENVYITQLIIEIFGHLTALGIDVPRQEEWKVMVNRALLFSLDEMKKRYKFQTRKQQKPMLDSRSLHAIYVTSFFTDLQSELDFKAWTVYYNLAKAEWTKRGLYDQAILASAFFRFQDEDYTQNIVASFRDKALRNEELGMYWKQNRGYYWHNQPIETHAHIMEAISLVSQNNDELNEMRIWLLKNKQTNRWASTVSTAKAIYALLLRGEDWLGSTQPMYVKLGSEIISSDNVNAEAQAGTGYVKRSWSSDEIKSSMKNLEVRNPNKIVGWGAAYWQYFQTIDQVKKYDDNPLKVKRNIYKKTRSSRGEELIPVTTDGLEIGDKVTIKLEITVDRMMEFIHLKDLRAAGVEPIDVLSGNKRKGGLYYYQSTTDLGSHFFIDHVQVGTYVIEYDGFATNAGNYSGGLATIECMYAPEFASHSEGSRLSIVSK